MYYFREELRLGPSLPGGSYKPVCNGAVGRRPTLIEPERLKDFGEEELLNGDVKYHQTSVAGTPEMKLMDPPKTRRVSEFRIIPKPPAQFLRFEDISAAAFTIQSAIQKTPCTVCWLCEFMRKTESVVYLAFRQLIQLTFCQRNPCQWEKFETEQNRDMRIEQLAMNYIVGLKSGSRFMHYDVSKLFVDGK